MSRQIVTKQYLLKNDMLYGIYKGMWGTHPRYYINFETLTQYNHKIGGTLQLYVNDNRVLCNSDDEALPDHIQQIYTDWIEAEIDRLLTGDKDD